MTAHFLLRHSGWAMLLAAAGVAACSNSPAPPPDTFVNAAVGGGPKCSSFSSAQTWLRIGTATAGHPNTVGDGGQDRNANVSVTCSVHPQGDGFQVQASAQEQGQQGGSLTINGTVNAMNGTGITASFVGMGSVSFSEQAGGPTNDPGCTITYQYDPGGSVGGLAGDQPVPVSPPVAAGRIWGHIHCPNALASGQPGNFCIADADFIFEQCDQ